MGRRIIWTLLFVGVCVGWLILSYRPGVLTGREVAFGLEVAPYFTWLFAGCALLFIIIQVALVAGVRTFPTRVTREGKGTDDSDHSSDQNIRIRPGIETIWTALPLLISLVLFWAIWQYLPR